MVYVDDGQVLARERDDGAGDGGFSRELIAERAVVQRVEIRGRDHVRGVVDDDDDAAVGDVFRGVLVGEGGVQRRVDLLYRHAIAGLRILVEHALDIFVFGPLFGNEVDLHVAVEPGEILCRVVRDRGGLVARDVDGRIGAGQRLDQRNRSRGDAEDEHAAQGRDAALFKGACREKRRHVLVGKGVRERRGKALAPSPHAFGDAAQAPGEGSVSTTHQRHLLESNTWTVKKRRPRSPRGRT